MKYLLVSLSFVGLMLVALPLFAQSPEDKIVGKWRAEKGDVAITREGDRYLGRPIAPPDPEDAKTELFNLGYKEGKWVGKLFAKKKNKYMDVVCVRKGDTLHVTIKAGWVTKQVEWTRIE